MNVSFNQLSYASKQPWMVRIHTNYPVEASHSNPTPAELGRIHANNM